MGNKHYGELFPALLYEPFVGVDNNSLQEKEVIVEVRKEPRLEFLIIGHTLLRAMYGIDNSNTVL